MGPILNTIIGAGIKLGCNLINSWLEQKRQDQMILAARDNAMLQAMIDNQAKQASDSFVKITRRVLFMSITFTMCYLMVFYAHNPDISYEIIVPKGENARWGFFSWVLGGQRLGSSYFNRRFNAVFFHGSLLYGGWFLRYTKQKKIIFRLT